jgi:hypothetical protein
MSVHGILKMVCVLEIDDDSKKLAVFEHEAAEKVLLWLNL